MMYTAVWQFVFFIDDVSVTNVCHPHQVTTKNIMIIEQIKPILIKDSTLMNQNHYLHNIRIVRMCISWLMFKIAHVQIGEPSTYICQRITMFVKTSPVKAIWIKLGISQYVKP